MKLALEDIYGTQKKINFNESEFVKLVLEYNKSKGIDSKIADSEMIIKKLNQNNNKACIIFHFLYIL